jgi:hypothetical protein
VLGDASESRADPLPVPHVPIGFSKLVVRLEGRDEVGIAGRDYSVALLEEMRARGFQAVGAENLVFGKDESSRAEYLVGGTVREVACVERWQATSCRIGIEWQVLDITRDEVVYSVMSRAALLDTPPDERGKIAGRLLLRAMDMLLARDNFRSVLVPHGGASRASDPAFPSATLAKCPTGRSVADAAEDLLAKVVVVKGRSGFGSGFLVSREGLVLTAAHVLKEGHVTIRLREGSELDYVPARVAAHADVALLRPVQGASSRPCLPIRVEPPPSGAEVYAVGAPESLSLAFSLTRGIVSGFPQIEGRRRLQTDTPVNPGNSGGPLVDGSGAVVGIVASKFAGVKVEGLAFAVPITDALAALGLRIGDASDPAPLSETAVLDEAPKVALYKDSADEIPSITPEGDRSRASKETRREHLVPEPDMDGRTPGFVPVMRWGGLTLGVVGVGVGLASYVSYNSLTTQPQFRTLEAVNVAGWIAAGAGLGLFALSFAFHPAAGSHPVVSSLYVGVGGVTWQGAF